MIQGLSISAPGGEARGLDTEAFYEFLQRRGSGIITVPKDRWNADAFYGKGPGKICTVGDRSFPFLIIHLRCQLYRPKVPSYPSSLLAILKSLVSRPPKLPSSPSPKLPCKDSIPTSRQMLVYKLAPPSSSTRPYRRLSAVASCHGLISLNQFLIKSRYTQHIPRGCFFFRRRSPVLSLDLVWSLW